MTGETIINTQSAGISFIVPQTSVKKNSAENTAASDMDKTEKSDFASVLKNKDISDTDKIENTSSKTDKPVLRETSKSESDGDETENTDEGCIENTAQLYVMINNYAFGNTEVQDTEISETGNTDIAAVGTVAENNAPIAIQTAENTDISQINEQEQAATAGGDETFDENFDTAVSDTQTYDENAENFVGFIKDLNISSNDIVSVKYTAHNIASLPETDAAKTNVENLLQKLFPTDEMSEEISESEIETTENSETGTIETVNAAAADTFNTLGTVQAAAEADSDNPEMEAKVSEIGTDGGEEDISYVNTVKDSDEQSSESQMSFDSRNEDFSGLKKQDTTVHNAVNNTSVNQTSEFKLYDIDTNKNIPNQVSNILTNMLTDKGLFDDVRDTKQMVIQLNPETLGKIMIKIQTVGEEMRVKIVSSNSEVRDMISSQLTQISNAIKEQGVNLASAEVANSPFDNAENMNQNSGSQRQNDDNQNQSEQNENVEYFSFSEQFEKMADGLSGRI